MVEVTYAGWKMCNVCNSRMMGWFPKAVRCSRCDMKCHPGCRQRMEETACRPWFSEAMTDQSNQLVFPPLYALVNGKSGGKQGAAMIQKLRQLLGASQVHDLSNGGPAPALERFGRCTDARMVVCGGDGTVGWALGALDKVSLPRDPAVSVIPLGTGNDMARALHWGGGYSGEDLKPVLKKAIRAQTSSLNRWAIEGTACKNPIMCNYFSFGVDARVAHAFHTLREAKPGLFKSRVVNKAWYGLLSGKSLCGNPVVRDTVEIEVDGQRIQVPPSVRGVMILNIPSYMGGTNLWGRETGSYQPQAIDDWLLEVVGVSGVMQIGRIRVKLSRALRLAQGGRVVVRTKVPIHMQVDGEPWLQDPCEAVVTPHREALMVLPTE